MSNSPFRRPSLSNPLETQESSEPESPAAPPKRRPKFRFSIKFMLLLMVVFSVSFAGFNSMNLGGNRQVGAVLFVVVAPFLLLAVFAALRFWQRSQRK